MSNGPSYHDVVVYVDGKAHRIRDNYGYELRCTRCGGWELWFHPGANWTGAAWRGVMGTVAETQPLPTGRDPVLIGGEFSGSPFRIEVRGVLVCCGPAEDGDSLG